MIGGEGGGLFDSRSSDIRHVVMFGYTSVRYLFGEYVVSVHGHCRAVGDEVRDRFHYVPRIFPPCESSQYAELHGHESQSDPSECRRLSAGHQINRLSFLKNINSARLMRVKIKIFYTKEEIINYI